MPTKVVLDTNVIISAALSPDGAPATLLALLLQYSRIVFSQATLVSCIPGCGSPSSTAT